MKRLITLTLCFFAILGVAKADDDKPITVNELPKKAQEFITKFFPQKEISFAKMEKDLWEKKYDVVFTNGEKIEFDKNGDWEEINCKFTVVPDTIIPKPIKEILTKQYSRAKVLKIEKDKNSYEIQLDNKLEIKFNHNFQIIDIDN